MARPSRHPEFSIFPTGGSGWLCLYAVEYLDGRVKLGCSRQMRERAYSHVHGRTERYIRRIHVCPIPKINDDLWLFERVDLMKWRERRALALAAKRGTRQGKTEYFTGLAMADAIACLREALWSA